MEHVENELVNELVPNLEQVEVELSKESKKPKSKKTKVYLKYDALVWDVLFTKGFHDLKQSDFDTLDNSGIKYTKY